VVPAVKLPKVVLDCQPVEGAEFDVFLAYSTVCPFAGAVTAFMVMLVPLTDDVPDGAFTAAPAALFTVKLMLSEAEMLFDPDTVTVAVYAVALTPRPVFGTTVNELLPPPAMLFIDVADNVKLLAFVPDNATVSAPVA
jgi:hypothetical protein